MFNLTDVLLRRCVKVDILGVAYGHSIFAGLIREVSTTCSRLFIQPSSMRCTPSE